MGNKQTSVIYRMTRCFSRLFASERRDSDAESLPEQPCMYAGSRSCDPITGNGAALSDRRQLLWALCLLVLWSAAGVLFVKSSGDLSLHSLLSYQPENKALAALVMCGLFLIKSVDFLLHCGVLFALSGIMFPLPEALVLNTAGICIMALVPYFIGRELGAGALDRLREKYPKLRTAEQAEGLSAFAFAFLLRGIGLPILPAGLFSGAKRLPLGLYMTASLIGVALPMIPYTVLGERAVTDGWRAVLPVLVMRCFLLALSFFLYRYAQHRQQPIP